MPQYAPTPPHVAPHHTTQARGDTRVRLTPALLHDGTYPTLHTLAASLSRCIPPALRAQGLLQRPGHLSLQLARYPGRGEGYVLHKDRSEAAPSRLFTIVFYLNLGVCRYNLPMCSAVVVALK